ARDLHVEGVAREAVGRPEHPVDAELGLTEPERVRVERSDGCDVDAEKEADRVLDALRRTLLPIHLDEDRREAALPYRVELERERVAEVAQDELDEGLRRSFEVEDVGPAVQVSEQEVGHLLQARDEAREIAGLVVTAVVLRQHPPEVEAPPLGARGAKAGEGGAVVRGEHGVTDEVRYAAHDNLVLHVWRHLG